MAITAWSANVSTRAISRGLYGSGDVSEHVEGADRLAIADDGNVQAGHGVSRPVVRVLGEHLGA